MFTTHTPDVANSSLIFFANAIIRARDLYARKISVVLLHKKFCAMRATRTTTQRVERDQRRIIACVTHSRARTTKYSNCSPLRIRCAIMLDHHLVWSFSQVVADAIVMATTLQFTRSVRASMQPVCAMVDAMSVSEINVLVMKAARRQVVNQRQRTCAQRHRG